MKHKILVVDDEKGICDMLDKFLTKKGYEVTMALSGEEALAKLKTEKPAIVLLDIKMPGMNGIEALKEMKKIYNDLCVVMITADTNEDVAKACIAAGASDYITKPLGLNYLEDVLMMKLMDCKKG